MGTTPRVPKTDQGDIAIDQTTLNAPTDDETEYYMVEGCGIFAMALAMAFPGGSIYVLSDKYGEQWSRSIPYEITHVFYQTVDGIAVDAKGQRNVEDIAASFGLKPRQYHLRGDFEPSEFQPQFMGDSDRKPLYGKAKDVKEALSLINRYRDFYAPSAPTSAHRP